MRNVLRDNCQPDLVSAYDIYIGGGERGKRKKTSEGECSGVELDGRDFCGAPSLPNAKGEAVPE